MTRRIVYGIGLWVFLAATALTLASLFLPNWITYRSPPVSSPSHPSNPIKVTYGSHQRCSSLSGSCTHFPQYEDCHGEERQFCSMWRSVGFSMNFGAVMELATSVAFAVVSLGGRQKREGGWKIIAGLLGFVSVVEAAGIGMIAFLFDHDSHFLIGSKLDTAWISATVSFIVMLLDGVGIAAAAYLSPSEGDYELIPDRR